MLKDGQIAVSGWQESSEMRLFQFLADYQEKVSVCNLYRCKQRRTPAGAECQNCTSKNKGISGAEVSGQWWGGQPPGPASP